MEMFTSQLDAWGFFTDPYARGSVTRVLPNRDRKEALPRNLSERSLAVAVGKQRA